MTHIILMSLLFKRNIDRCVEVLQNFVDCLPKLRFVDPMFQIMVNE